MAFIKVQKLVRNDDGSVRSGSASILTTEYDRSYKGLSRHRIREKLGKVIALDDAGKSGVFLSPTRGLVAYDSVSDTFEAVEKEDPRITDRSLVAEPKIHTVFGDVYLLLQVCEKLGLIEILRTAFPQDREYEEVLLHLIHSVLRDGSRISCEDFISNSFASYLFDPLGSDTAYFSMMGSETSKTAFFKAFVAHMRKQDPLFGTACYVDATPLATTTIDNPFHALRGNQSQVRLALIVDEKTGFPIWFSLHPSTNLQDLHSTMEDVAENLDIRIDSFILDTEYTSNEILEAFSCKDEIQKTLTVRMPAKNGYPYKTLYQQAKKLMGSAKYELIREGHTYFGKHFETELLGHKMHAYVYVDKEQALQGCREYRQEFEDEYQKLTDREKSWYSVRFGFFILLSTEKEEPDAKLDEYFERRRFETEFKSSERYLDQLPLEDCSDLTIRGMLLSTIVSNTASLLLKQTLSTAGISLSHLIGKTRSLICTRKNGMVIVETPNKQVEEIYHKLKVKIPSAVSLEQFRRETLHLQSNKA